MNYNSKGSWIGAGVGLVLAAILTMIIGFRGFISIVFCCFLFGLGGVVGSMVYAKKFSKKESKAIIIYIVCFAIIIGLFVIGVKMYHENSTKDKNEKLNEILNKDPNTWTEEEKKHVDDLFEWIDEQDRENDDK